MRKIVIYPNKILRVKTPILEKIDKETLGEMKDLREILMSRDNGAGLAAPQIGVEKRFFGLKDHEGKRVNIYINPKIKAVFGEKVFPMIVDDEKTEEDFLEGCLSFPGFWGMVKRWLKIETSWQELVGKKLEERKKTMTGFEAIVFQHELDHLDGILFTDHIKEDQGKFYKQMGKEMVKWDVDSIKSKK